MVVGECDAVFLSPVIRVLFPPRCGIDLPMSSQLELIIAVGHDM